MREDHFFVSQHISANVGGHVAGRDVNVWSTPWQWYAEQETESLKGWRDTHQARYSEARQRILFSPSAKLAWVALTVLLLILAVAIASMAMNWAIPPYVFNAWAVGVALLLLSLTNKKQYERQVDFMIKAQSRVEMMRIDAELRARDLSAKGL